MTTINKEEIQKFSKLAEEWWDVNGKFKPLHMFNPIRIEYIVENIKKHFNILEKIFIAPYWVHYHLEHHLLMWVPCYRLPQLNKFLCENGYKENLKKTVGYLNVLKEVTCESLANDPRSGSGAKGTFGQGYS